MVNATDVASGTVWGATVLDVTVSDTPVSDTLGAAFTPDVAGDTVWGAIALDTLEAAFTPRESRGGNLYGSERDAGFLASHYPR